MFQLLHYFLKPFGSLHFLNQLPLGHDLCLENILSLMFLLLRRFVLEQMQNELDDVSVADNNIIVVTNMGIIVIGFRCFLANVVPFISLILSIWKLYMTPGKYAINVNWVQILM